MQAHGEGQSIVGSQIHAELRHTHTNGTSGFGAAKKRSLGCARAVDTVEAIVAEGLSRGQTRCLTHDPITLYHKQFAMAIGHDPLASDEGYRLLRIVVDGQKINKGMRASRVCARVWLMDQLIHRDR